MYRSSVIRAVRLLASRGWLNVESGNRRRSNRYRIAFGSFDMDETHNG
jgi:hypothetical protein